MPVHHLPVRHFLRGVAAAACAGAVTLSAPSPATVSAPSPTAAAASSSRPAAKPIVATTLTTALPTAAPKRRYACPHTSRRGDFNNGCWAMTFGVTDAKLRECKADRLWLRSLLPKKDRRRLHMGQCEVRWAQWEGRPPEQAWSFVWSVKTKYRGLDLVE